MIRGSVPGKGLRGKESGETWADVVFPAGGWEEQEWSKKEEDQQIMLTNTARAVDAWQRAYQKHEKMTGEQALKAATDKVKSLRGEFGGSAAPFDLITAPEPYHPFVGPRIPEKYKDPRTGEMLPWEEIEALGLNLGSEELKALKEKWRKDNKKWREDKEAKEWKEARMGKGEPKRGERGGPADMWFSQFTPDGKRIVLWRAGAETGEVLPQGYDMGQYPAGEGLNKKGPLKGQPNLLHRFGGSMVYPFRGPYGAQYRLRNEEAGFDFSDAAKGTPGFFYGHHPATGKELTRKAWEELTRGESKPDDDEFRRGLSVPSRKREMQKPFGAMAPMRGPKGGTVLIASDKGGVNEQKAFYDYRQEGDLESRYDIRNNPTQERILTRPGYQRGGLIPSYHNGGMVRNLAGGGDVLARLQENEFVLKANAASRLKKDFGPDFLNNMNNYHNGGAVQAQAASTSISGGGGGGEISVDMNDFTNALNTTLQTFTQGMQQIVGPLAEAGDNLSKVDGSVITMNSKQDVNVSIPNHSKGMGDAMEALANESVRQGLNQILTKQGAAPNPTNKSSTTPIGKRQGLV